VIGDVATGCTILVQNICLLYLLYADTITSVCVGTSCVAVSAANDRSKRRLLQPVHSQV